MQRTPLLRPLRDNGATLYVFPSASEDIGLNLNSRATGVAMSHYALLNLPNIFGETGSKESELIAQDLQNYVMNFETLLLNQDTYNFQDYHTVSERVFFHWLTYRLKEKYGFKDITSQTTYKKDTNDNYKSTGETSAYYKTETVDDTNSGKTLPNKFIQCFGSIDAGNSLSTEFGMFNETYVNIPTSYGNGPVFLKQVQDSTENNYILGNRYIASTSGQLEGRDETKIDTLKILKDSNPIYDDKPNKVYIASEAYEIVKDINEIQSAIREYTGNDDIQISSYDDINIDNKEQFKNTIFDITSNTVEFGFNAILLYYSVYDQDDMSKSPYAINLFGIVFLNSPNTDKPAVIPCLMKKKSFSGTSSASFFGNSYSFRVNIKTMSVYDNTDAIIQDNTTMSSISSVDFSDVVSNLNRAIDVMNTNVQSTMAIQDQYMQILRYYDEQRDNIDDISTKVNGFINGSKTSVLSVKQIKTDDIRPLDSSKNTIKFTLQRRQSDYVENSNYQASDLIPSIYVTNDYDTFNTPTVYKPMLDVSSMSPTALGEWTDTIGQTSDIIDNIEIKYYTYLGKTYPSITLPESNITGYGLDRIYRTAYSIDEDVDNDSSLIKYINYDGLMPLLITYIQDLKSQITELQAQVTALKK